MRRKDMRRISTWVPSSFLDKLKKILSARRVIDNAHQYDHFMRKKKNEQTQYNVGQKIWWKSLALIELNTPYCSYFVLYLNKMD